MSKVIDAGISTAYGAAVRGGYTGTYEKFCEDLVKLADVLSEFLGFSVTVETLAEGEPATASYDGGILSLGIPRGNTGNGIQSIVLNADYTMTVTYTNGNTWTSGSIRGQVGATPHLTIGTVETLPPSQSASATITGTDENPVLNLSIPKGDTGEVSQSEFDALSDDVNDLTRQISDVESTLSDVEVLLEIPINETYSGIAEASLQTQRISGTISLKAGHVYTYTITIASASNQDVYVYLWDGTSTSISSLSLIAGDTTMSKVYIAPSDIDVTIAVNDRNRAIDYTITIADGDQTNVIDDINAHLNEVDDDVIELKDRLDNVEIALEMPVDVSASGSIRHVSAPYPISDTFELIEGHTYTYAITLNSASDSMLVLYIYNDQDQSLSSVTVNAGQTYKSKTYTATANVTAHLMIYDSHAENEISYTATIQDNDLLNVVNKVKSNIANLIEAPIETLPEYICHSLAYRPAGVFRQGYLCLSCDDGTEGLQTYTIPMLTEKNVPCTFGLWATSSQPGETPVYSPSVILQTQEGINLVKTAINNLGCSVAQHGNINWTDMTERQLNTFFDREQAAFESMGITVKGAICPSHCVNDRIRAIVGGRFGSVRSGYGGFLSSQDAANHIPGDVFNPYPHYLTGPKSNCYSYTSYNVIDTDKSLEALKTGLDYAMSQNFVMIIYWHDWNFLPSDSGYQANREKLEAFIDYAKTKSAIFTTIDKIPKLK